MSVYLAAIKYGDTILGMNLSHGGHLTHGHPMNFSGISYRVADYGVSPETEQIDYDDLQRRAEEHRPQMIVCGASAYPRIDQLRAHRRDRARRRGARDGRHRAHRRIGRGRSAPVARAARRLCDDDDAQDSARAARRLDLVPGRARGGSE
jgi:hypothetical protein